MCVAFVITDGKVEEIVVDEPSTTFTVDYANNQQVNEIKNY